MYFEIENIYIYNEKIEEILCEIFHVMEHCAESCHVKSPSTSTFDESYPYTSCMNGCPLLRPVSQEGSMLSSSAELSIDCNRTHTTEIERNKAIIPHRTDKRNVETWVDYYVRTSRFEKGKLFSCQWWNKKKFGWGNECARNESCWCETISATL